MKKNRVASLVPGRVQGVIERDPKRRGSDKVLVLRQDEIRAISDPPGGLFLIEAAPFSHSIIRWLGRGVPVALMDLDQVNEWEPHAPVVLDAASGELRAWDAPTVPKPWDPPTAPSLGQSLRIADGTEIRLCARVADQLGVRRAVANGSQRAPTHPRKTMAESWGCRVAAYSRRRPEQTVQQHLETYLVRACEGDGVGHAVPGYVEWEFRRYLECGILAHGFARARCGNCGHDFPVAFSCKGRTVFPSCNARRISSIISSRRCPIRNFRIHRKPMVNDKHRGSGG